MRYLNVIGLCVFTILCEFSGAQNLQFKGQASAWANFNPSNDLELWGGIRYLPQLNLKTPAHSIHLFDMEASANLNGIAGTHPFDTIFSDGNIKPYRLWVRWSTPQLEIRAGLQKINFGSAAMIRPLMWFDKLDPRDPLQFTDGVWGLLGRYYFLNNANIWLWALYGNEASKTWEIGQTSQERPELGGRIQWPVPRGEIAFSYHNRAVIKSAIGEFPVIAEPLDENRFGLDGKWDLGIGLWFEAVWMNKSKNIGSFTNQISLNAGADYTFGIGNGLNIILENLLFAYDEKPFQLKDPYLFSMVSLNYPLGLNDHLSSIIYYDWSNNGLYNMVTWNHQFDRLMLYVMGYSNPTDYKMPLTVNDINLFAGTGIQCMFVFNH